MRATLDQHAGEGYEYRLTEAGQELESVLHLLRQWGDRHLADQPPVIIEHSCGADLDPVVMCRSCEAPVTADACRVRFQVPGWSAAGATV